jgi:hypothetical protein
MELAAGSTNAHIHKCSQRYAHIELPQNFALLPVRIHSALPIPKGSSRPFDRGFPVAIICKELTCREPELPRVVPDFDIGDGVTQHLKVSNHVDHMIISGLIVTAVVLNAFDNAVIHKDRPGTQHRLSTIV